MRRLALLVATYRYQDTGLRQLTAPGHDAEALAGVLRQPNIANFDVTILVNEPHYVVGSVIGEFYRNRRRDDLTLLYFTGHGLKDDEGRLYLAMTDTKRDDLLFTALSAQQIDDAMNSCPSRQKVLILDCCYSGAFPVGRISKAGTEVHTLEKFQGRGRVVLTASDATQYSLEGNKIFGKGTGSVFTRFLVEGIETGKGDLDGDGDISLDELYSYVYDRVIEEIPQQRPRNKKISKDASSLPETYTGACPPTFGTPSKARLSRNDWTSSTTWSACTATVTTWSEPMSSTTFVISPMMTTKWCLRPQSRAWRRSTASRPRGSSSQSLARQWARKASPGRGHVGGSWGGRLESCY